MITNKGLNEIIDAVAEAANKHPNDPDWEKVSRLIEGFTTFLLMISVKLTQLTIEQLEKGKDNE